MSHIFFRSSTQKFFSDFELCGYFWFLVWTVVSICGCHSDTQCVSRALVIFCAVRVHLCSHFSPSPLLLVFVFSLVFFYMSHPGKLSSLGLIVPAVILRGKLTLATDNGILQICVLSLTRGHNNLLCNIPVLVLKY